MTSDSEANICFHDLLTDYFHVLPGDRKVGKICMLPVNLGIPYLHHYHHDCVPGNLICHQKELSGERIAKFSKLLLANSANGAHRPSKETQVDARFVTIDGYNFQSKHFIFRENTLVFIKRFESRPPQNMSDHALIPTATKDVFYSYQALFYLINKQKEPQPIEFLLQRKGSENVTSVKITGKYSFSSNHHNIPSPIKDVCDVVTKHIKTIMPPLRIIEVTDGFLSPVNSSIPNIAVHLPHHFHSLIKES